MRSSRPRPEFVTWTCASWKRRTRRGKHCSKSMHRLFCAPNTTTLIPTNPVSTMPVISHQLVRDLIRKYADVFTTRFPFANMDVHFTENGLPPLPQGIKRDAPKEVFGASIKAGNTHLIGIHRQ